MAKKQQSLSLEDRLEQALVPVEEQPYAVPENWVWTRLGSVIFIARGGSPRPIKNFITNSEEGINWIKIGDTKKGTKYITETKEKIIKEGMSKSRYVKKGDFLLSNSMSFGRPYILNIDGCIHDGWLVLSDFSKMFLKDYLFYLLSSSLVYEQFAKIVTGAVVDNLNSEKVSLTIVPIPPLPEQKRIVSRIESLFSKLDEAKELIESALNSFEERKSAVLHKAFTGALTKKWREQNGVSLESWGDILLGTKCVQVTKGASPNWQGVEYTKDSSQTLFITSENVREGYLDLTKEKYLDNKINEIQKRSVLQRGDVLLNIVGASIGRSAIFNSDKLANTNQAVAILRTKEINHSFLCRFLNSPLSLHYYSSNKVDVARANLSLTDIKNMPIHLPSLPEQEEIVRILDTLLEKEDKSKELLSLLGEIDLMKKAILGRAFRGDLGTNQAEEENAMGGVREVLQEKG